MRRSSAIGCDRQMRLEKRSEQKRTSHLLADYQMVRSMFLTNSCENDYGPVNSEMQGHRRAAERVLTVIVQKNDIFFFELACL